MLFTKFTFVTTRMVELLDFIVRELAILAEAAAPVDFLALDMIVFVEIGAAVVLLVVVVEAGVLVMTVYMKREVHYFLQGEVLNVKISKRKN